MNKKRNQIGLIVALTALSLSGCIIGGPAAEVGDQIHGYETVPMLAADSVDVVVEMGAGEVLISGGASDLMEADFIYNVAELEPEIESGSDFLHVLTPQTRINLASLRDADEFRNLWDLRFNESARLKMDINLGAGKAELDLGGLNLERLDIDSGAGDMQVRLVGSNLELFHLDAGVGRVEVDLSGAWTHDLDVKIDSGVGELTVILPSEVGVSVQVDGGIVSLNADGLTRSNGRYVNEAAGGTGPQISINIDAGVGEINLVFAEL